MNNKEPLISIIMPVYNSELYINEAILSVLNQTYPNWELLLIDDKSSDNTLSIINPYLVDKRINLIKNIKNIGPAATRNIGLDNAKGEYITFLDSDDFLSKNKLQDQVEFMAKNNLDMTHGNYVFCQLDGSIIKNINIDRIINFNLLLKGNQFKIMTVMIRRKAINGLRFPLIKHEDYAFFLDCLKIVRKSYLYQENYDSFVRIGKVSVSSNKIKSAIWTWNIYRKYLKLNIFSSIYNFIHYAINGFIKYRIKNR